MPLSYCANPRSQRISRNRDYWFFIALVADPASAILLYPCHSAPVNKAHFTGLFHLFISPYASQ